jgi:uncharacterized protein YdeI (YjbR/CyaY-like superfamily)
MTLEGTESLAGLPILLFETAGAWERWLAEHVAQADGLWLKHAKKTSGLVAVSYAEALDVALCYGWIDGQKQSYDNQYYLQKWTPRRPRSVWSKTNIDHVARLEREGRMKPAGLAAVAAAKADGRWAAAYDSSATMTVPEDLAAALEANPQAKAFWATLNRTNTYAFCYRVQSAQKPETRQARIEKFVAMLAAGKKQY